MDLEERLDYFTTRLQRRIGTTKGFKEVLQYNIKVSTAKEIAMVAGAKAREAKALKEVESVLANRRQAILNGKNKLTPVSAEASNVQSKGESRNIVAKKVGLKSGHEVDRSIKAINTIDELTEKGRWAHFDTHFKINNLYFDFHYNYWLECKLIPFTYIFRENTRF